MPTAEKAKAAGTSQVDSSQLYGFIKELPVKVGGGMSSGPEDQQAYLNALRDAQGKKIAYERQGSCCNYKTSSPLALFGSGLLDMYQVKYRDENNKKRKTVIYITFYDYEKPKAVKGFTLIE